MGASWDQTGAKEAKQTRSSRETEKALFMYGGTDAKDRRASEWGIE